MGPASERLVVLLSRWRVGLAWFGLLVFPFARPTPTSILTGLPLVMAGIALRLWARGHLERAQKVSRGGPYAFVRHPLYIGSFCIAVGFGCMTGVAIMPLFVAAAFLLMYVPRAMREEAHLRRCYRAPYDAYAKRVRAVIPSWPAPAPSPTRFAWHRVMREGEWKTWLGTAAFLAVMCGLAIWQGPHLDNAGAGIRGPFAQSSSAFDGR